MDIDKKEAAALSAIAGYGSAAVAFSGGVDSSYLCALAAEALGPEALAITVDSPLMPRSELEDARRVAGLVGIEHLIIREGPIDEAVAANPPDRCYLCKRIKMGAMLRVAEGRGIAALLEGSNIDDLADYRPGRVANEELGVRSPLADAGMTKDDIRELSRRRGLRTWDKPAFACLASRVPYGDRLDAPLLARIEAAEDYLRGLGFRQCRVRSHDGSARIEVAPDERRKFFDESTMDGVSCRLKLLGFTFVSLELEGYSMGSLNRTLGTERTES
ncbi:MAG TPA: ATP-dependent sacrificial sulfur transferase LarE [Spirochaetia bacterium]|nr:ATP-dependent sacrificial sulfur transferase LarE [Spirochaetaceae bacterium]HPE88216.1 ATP-dependent sacrificial sulfur transferase LarE [Spirochaetales bacterium]HRW23761.1 ATP-dependent sacrificial sulfur transferase LarE [Spirochaetia bacterium]